MLGISVYHRLLHGVGRLTVEDVVQRPSGWTDSSQQVSYDSDRDLVC